MGEPMGERKNPDKTLHVADVLANIEGERSELVSAAEFLQTQKEHLTAQLTERLARIAEQEGPINSRTEHLYMGAFIEAATLRLIRLIETGCLSRVLNDIQLDITATRYLETLLQLIPFRSASAWLSAQEYGTGKTNVASRMSAEKIGLVSLESGISAGMYEEYNKAAMGIHNILSQALLAQAAQAQLTNRE